MKIDIYKLEDLRKMNQLNGSKELCFINQIQNKVKWLKEEIYRIRKISHPISNNDLYKLIDKAFEDLRQEK